MTGNQLNHDNRGNAIWMTACTLNFREHKFEEVRKGWFQKGGSGEDIS